MDRLPEHFSADPILRNEFCDQQSLDEHEDAVFELMGLEPGDIAGWIAVMRATDPDISPADFLASLKGDWLKAINPRTNISEILYLQGVTDPDERFEINEASRARLLSAAVEKGWFGTEPNPN